MGFLGRHRVYAMIWPWEFEPFLCDTDIARCSISKSVAQGQSMKLSLYPRAVSNRPRGHGTTAKYGYMDMLHPNDWILVFVDTGTDMEPEPLFFGFIDSVMLKMSCSNDGRRSVSVEVSCSGWEKAIQNVSAITSPFISRSINIAMLASFGPLGWRPDSGRRSSAEYLNEDKSLISSESVRSEAGPYISVLPPFIETLIAAFLQTEHSQGLGLSDPTLLVGRARVTDSSEDLNPMMRGQYSFPGSQTPLWDFIRLRFQDLRQGVYADTRMFLSGITKSLASLIDTVSNQLMNEVFYDVRAVDNDGLNAVGGEFHVGITGGYTRQNMRAFLNVSGSTRRSFRNTINGMVPTMVLRLRPLFRDELLELQGPTIHESDVLSMTIGKSDSDLHNLTSIEMPSVNAFVRAEGNYPAFRKLREPSLESMRRHGLRLYNDRTVSWPMVVAGEAITAPQPNIELIKDWEIRLHAAGLDNVSVYSGSMAIAKYVSDLWIGGKIILERMDTPMSEIDPKDRVFYVDGLSYSYNAITGNFVTDAKISRGYIVGGGDMAMSRAVVGFGSFKGEPKLPDGAT